MSGADGRNQGVRGASAHFVRGAAPALLLVLVAFGPPQDPQDQDVIVADQTIIEKQADGKWRTLLIGNVTLKSAGKEVRADRVVGWSKEEAGGFDDMYAEGHVRFTREEREVRADALYYDLVNERTSMLGMEAKGFNKKTGKPYYIRARTARELERGVFEADDIVLTTCEYADPHTDVAVKRGTIRGINERPQHGAFEIFPFQGYELEAEDITPQILGVPYFYLPYFTFSSDMESPLRKIKPGRSGRFGTFLLTEWGFNLARGDVEAFGGVDEARAAEKWGEVTFDADWRQKRGFATGINMKYEWDQYFGDLDTYWLIDDKGPTSNDFDRRFSNDGHRGRIKYFHRHDFLDHWRVEGEVSWLSDRDLLEEFFEKEFKEGKEQETTLYGRYLDGNRGGYAQAKMRINDFLSQTEYLPRFGFAWIAEPIATRGRFGDAYITGRGELANIRTRFDDRLDLDEDRTWRFDGRAEVSLPIEVDPVSYLPFIGARATLYERDADGDPEARFILMGGARAKAQFSRVFNVDVPELGMHGLRHQMNFGAGILANAYVNTDRDQFFPHDELDAAYRYSEIYFETQHRLETKVRQPDGTLAAREFLYGALGIEFYPGEGRDTGRRNPNNVTPPFNWITIYPDLDGTFRERSFSNIYWELGITPAEIVTARFSGEIDPTGGGEISRFGSVNVRPIPPVDMTFTHAYVRGVTNSYGAVGRFQLAEKWTVGGGFGYDTRRDDFITQSVYLERDYHDLILRAQFLKDFGRDEDVFLIELVPKFMQALKTTDTANPFGILSSEGLGARIP